MTQQRRLWILVAVITTLATLVPTGCGGDISTGVSEPGTWELAI